MSGEASNALQAQAHEATERGRPGSEVAVATTPTTSHSLLSSQATRSMANASASLRTIQHIAGEIPGAEVYLRVRGIDIDEMMRTSDLLLESIARRTRAVDESNRRIDAHFENIARTAGAIDLSSFRAQLTLEEGLSRLADAVRNGEPIHHDLPASHHLNAGNDLDEAYDVATQAHESDQNASDPEYQQQISDQPGTTTAPQSNSSSNDGTSSTNATATVATQVTPPNTTMDDSANSEASEQSNIVRRNLERAVRDYRMTRRTLGTRSIANAALSADQHGPSHQGDLARPAEPQASNRNRMRARGQSRAHSLTQRHSTDIDSAVSQTHQAGDELSSPILSNSQRALTGPSDHSGDAGALVPASRSNLQPVISSSAPYLGPTSSARGSGTAAGGMRNFWRRMDGSDRNVPRTAATTSRVGVPFPERNTGSGSLALTNTRDSNQHVPLEGISTAAAIEQGRVIKLLYNVSKHKAKRVLRYLTTLRKFNNDAERSAQYAKTLGIDDLDARLARGEVDFPLRIAELPRPPFSSWLEPGLSWTGKQKSGYGKHDTDFGPVVTVGLTSGPLFGDDEEDGPRRNRQPSVEETLLQMRAMSDRQRQSRQAATLAVREAGRALVRRTGAPTGASSGLDSSLDTMAGVQRHISDLLEEEERRLNSEFTDGAGRPRISGVEFGAYPHTRQSTPEPKPQDEWPVQVTIHQVDWQKMTVSGTMTASQIPYPSQRAGAPGAGEHPAAADATARNDNRGDASFTGASMETLFDGEIIDFHNHELETVTTKIGYRVGGLLTDLKYWSRVGPFKQECEKRLEIAKEQKAWAYYLKMGLVGTLDQMREEYKRTCNIKGTGHEELDRDETEGVMFSVMAGCLGSRKWIEEQLLGDNGWILMRWKERSFVSPDPSPSSSNPSAANSEPASTDAAPAESTTNTNDSAVSTENTAADTNISNDGNTTTNTGTVSTATRANEPEVFANVDLIHNPQRRAMSYLHTLVHRSSPTTQTYTTSYTDEHHPEYAAHNNGQPGSWGLTIQGFYYVALHRLSGRIDALYFDSGSQPFQELSCVPVDIARVAENFALDDENEENDEELAWLNCFGLRTSFPAVEFR